MSSPPTASVEPLERTDAMATERRILDAALALFSERGVAATSLRSVAKAAGVSLGCLQYHFRTKALLERAVLETAMRAYRDEQASAFDSADEDFATLMRRGLHNYYRWARNNPEVIKLGARMSLEERNDPWPGEEELTHELVRRVRAAQQAGLIRDVDPTLLLTLVGIVMGGWAMHQGHHRRRLPHLDATDLDRTFADFVTSVFIDGIVERP